MDIWEKGGWIFIKVNNHFTYDLSISKINRIGSPSDSPSVLSMWGRINHLREKNWWNEKTERSFISLCEKVINS